MQRVYFISGLGADEQAFQLLNLTDIDGKLIKWLKPETNETTKSYIKKLNKEVTEPENSIIIGLSFGGILTIELAKINNFKKTIIISSIKSKKEKPIIFRFLGAFKLYKIVPAKTLTNYNCFVRYMFGVKKGDEEDEILKEAIESTDPKLVKWAMKLLATWNSTKKIKNLTHIHGTKDRIFPIMFIKDTVKIRDGGHFMIAKKAHKIGEIINKEIHG